MASMNVVLESTKKKYLAVSLYNTPDKQTLKNE